MKALNKETAVKTVRPERIIQFGEGNFLRAFVDWIIWNMNQKTDFNSSVVVVQPIEKGMVDMLNGQDDLYHVNLQGLDKGEAVNSLTMIDVISRALNPYTQHEAFMQLGANIWLWQARPEATAPHRTARQPHRAQLSGLDRNPARQAQTPRRRRQLYFCHHAQRPVTRAAAVPKMLIPSSSAACHQPRRKRHPQLFSKKTASPL